MSTDDGSTAFLFVYDVTTTDSKMLSWVLSFLIPCHLFLAYVIELVAVQQAKAVDGRTKKCEAGQQGEGNITSRNSTFQPGWTYIAVAHAINAPLNLLVATVVVYYGIYQPGIGTLCEVRAGIIWLKTCSYALTNRDLRQALLSPSSTDILPELYSSCP